MRAAVSSCAGVLETPGDLAQQQVTGLVAEGVIDSLEAVQIEEAHRKPATVTAGVGQDALDAVGEQGAIG